MLTADTSGLELAESWVEGDSGARWRSAPATSPDQGTRSSGSCVLELEAGHRLPRHTDSAEETIVVLEGRAQVEVGGERGELGPGGVALVPADVPHEVRSVGDGRLRFLALYADADVVTRYEAEVQPDGERERRPLEG
jgi:quercetin dioxygenase-like cupin family protein